MSRITIWFSIAVVMVLAVALTLVLSRPIDPIHQPGVSWTRGFLMGNTLRLLDSGRYVNVSWCDICVDERAYGRWTRVAGGYRLQPDSGRPPVVLNLMRYRGCTVLAAARVTSDSYLPGYYMRVDDKCDVSQM